MEDARDAEDAQPGERGHLGTRVSVRVRARARVRVRVMEDAQPRERGHLGSRARVRVRVVRVRARVRVRVVRARARHLDKREHDIDEEGQRRRRVDHCLPGAHPREPAMEPGRRSEGAVSSHAPWARGSTG